MIDEDFQRYYARGRERDWLTHGDGTLELVRTRELLQRYLPPPADVLGVGNAPGVYTAWLTTVGYGVRFIGPSPRRVEQAVTAAAAQQDRPLTAAVGDARQLHEPAAAFEAVLPFGPLNHLTNRAERITAPTEARRVLQPSGLAPMLTTTRFG